LPLVKTHGFTREALARSVLELPPNEAHSEPLSDTAVSALFGNGDFPRRTLIRAWLQDGLRHMGSVGQPTANAALDNCLESGKKAMVGDVLRARLEYNEPVLSYLPEVRYRGFSGSFDNRLSRNRHLPFSLPHPLVYPLWILQKPLCTHFALQMRPVILREINRCK